MNSLDATTADKLAKVCGLFGSDHDGERATAAAKANEIVRERGLSWSDLITAEPVQSTDSMIEFALDYGDGILNCWECGFLRGVSGRQYLTDRQLSKLGHVFAKVKARAA
jgi:hypothetical protein